MVVLKKQNKKREWLFVNSTARKLNIESQKHNVNSSKLTEVQIRTEGPKKERMADERDY